MKETIYGPEMRDGKHVFVFGSNTVGAHGKGAALDAAKYWGAERGVPIGRTGMAYAIPTRSYWMGRFDNLDLQEIRNHVNQFIDYASIKPEIIFLVTRIGCGLAGYRDDQIVPMFKDAPKNCVLPDGWRVEP